MRSVFCVFREAVLPEPARALSLTTVLLPAVLTLVSCGGCGSGNRTVTVPVSSASTGTALLEGNAAHRAAIVAGYHSFAAGVAYPLTALEIVSPSGSVIRSGADAASARAASSRSASSILASAFSFNQLSPILQHGVAAQRGAATRQASSGALTYSSALNLYAAEPIYSGNTLTLGFYTDAAGTQSAGAMTLTLPAGFDASNTNYTAYPVKITLGVNLTGGNLPCSGTIVITFNGSSGNNTLTGTLTLPKDPVTFNIALALDDSGDVSGSITGQENGATIRLTNCSGNLFGTLNCDLEIAPYGWKGTASGSFLTGQFTTMVDTSSGAARSTVDANGSLDITYPDGTSETVTDPIVASLISGGGTILPTPRPTATPTPAATPTPTPSPTSTTTTYAAPVSLVSINPTAINNADQILATRAGDNVPIFLSGPTATPVALSGGFGVAFPYSVYSALAMNNSGQIVEFANQVPAVFWSSPTATAQTLAGSGTAEAFAINDSGTIAGDLVATYSSLPTVWSSPNTPAALQAPAGYGHAAGLGISANGQIVGYADNGSASIPVYWASATAAPQLLTLPASYTGTVNEMGINNSGQIYATIRISGYGSDTDVYYWSSPTATGQLLPTLDSSNRGAAFGINASGTIVGVSGGGGAPVVGMGSSSSTAVTWRNGQITNLNTLIPTGTIWTLNSGTGINDNGDIVGIGTQSGAGVVGAGTYAFLIKHN